MDKPIEFPIALLEKTFVIQHNPNCPSPWLIRLPGKSMVIDLKPYYSFNRDKDALTGDKLGFGLTIDEAYENVMKLK